MKKLLSIVAIVALSSFAFISWNAPENPPAEPGDDLNLGFPEEVMTILETACLDCHQQSSKNDKAKTKLNFSQWNDLKASKKIGKLDAICEVVQEGDMPPQKYLDYYPDRKLTDEQKKIICQWVEEEAGKLLEE